MLAQALGIEVKAGEPTGELMGRCIERAEGLSAMAGAFEVSPMPKPGQSGVKSRKGVRGGAGRPRRGAEVAA